jgi:hypothetical protein
MRSNFAGTPVELPPPEEGMKKKKRKGTRGIGSKWKQGNTSKNKTLKTPKQRSKTKCGKGSKNNHGKEFRTITGGTEPDSTSYGP